MFQRAASATNPPMLFAGRQDNKASIKTPDQVRKFQPASNSSEKEMDEKSIREKELEAIAAARANTNWEDGEEEKLKELSVREMKSKELQDIALYRETNSEKMFEDLTDAEERAIIEKEKRRQELEAISASRTKTKWEEVVSPQKPRSTASSVFNQDLEAVSRGNIRDTAQVWQERELCKDNRDSFGNNEQRNVPTRRIGNIFSHSPNQWKMDDDDDEEFPAPPTQDEVDAANEMFNTIANENENVTTLNESEDAVFGFINVTIESNTENKNVNIEEMPPEPTETDIVPATPQPVPPPRDSSKDYMREWSKDENNLS